jgi:hypothetical protein
MYWYGNNMAEPRFMKLGNHAMHRPTKIINGGYMCVDTAIPEVIEWAIAKGINPGVYIHPQQYLGLYIDDDTIALEFKLKWG